jgi:hypothetical protein
MIPVNNVQPKPYRGRPRANTQGTYHAEIQPGRSIRIFGVMTNHGRYDPVLRQTVPDPQAFDRTFTMGDEVEYHSYNLIYTGRIVGIGPKTVTIKHYPHSDTVTRLDLYSFIDRNWDFDAARIDKHNAEEMQCL